MAKRTSLLVIVGAMAMLVASFSLQTNLALAHDSNEDAVNAIWEIKHGAWNAIDGIVDRAADEIGAATSQSEAKAFRNSALGTLETVYWQALDDMWSEVEDAHFSERVEAAFWDAKAVLDGHASGAYNEIHALYDAWVAANSGPTPEEVIAKIQQKLQNGLNRLDAIVSDFGEALAIADTETAAVAAHDEALEDVEDRIEITTNRLDNQLNKLPDDPNVQAAHAAAMAEFLAAAEAATRTINDMFNDWAPPPPPSVTTTTTVPPPTTTTTTTTVPPTTTTTMAPPPPPTTTTTTTTTTLPPTTTTSAPPPPTTTTTTTLAPAAQLPPTEPPIISETAYMPDLPEPVVLSATVAEGEAMQSETGMATVGFVRRVVDTRLPAGISTVAAGPLVVLGLIIDAIRAAGTLMLIPWIVLGAYMVMLLRGRPTQPGPA